MIEGVKLTPQLLFNNHNTTRFTCCYSRPGFYEPVEYFVSWLDGNIGRVGVASIAVPGAVSILTDYTSVKDISICFDGSWARQGEGFIFITHDYPIIATCNMDGNINVAHDDGNNYVIDGDFTAVAIIRGWKSLIDDSDQGLILVAARQGALVIYSYTTAWSIVETIEIPYTVKYLSMSTLADYRVCLYVVDTDENTHSLYTDRFYISGAAKGDTASIKDIELGECTINVVGIEKTSYSYKESDFAVVKDIVMAPASISTMSNKQPNTNDIYAYNTSDTEIRIYIPTMYNVLNTTGIVIKSPNGIRLPIQSFVTDGYELVLTCTKFNNFTPEMDITYDKSSGSIKLTSGTVMESFNVSYVATGLIPDEVDPPKLIGAVNIELQ